MLILLIILLPSVVGLGLYVYKGEKSAYLGFFGMLMTLIPILYSILTDTTSQLVIPSFSQATWSFHPYSLVGAVAFPVVGSILLLFVTSYLSKPQILTFCVAISSALGITLARHFVSLFLFWELLTISTALIIFLEQAENKRIGKLFLFTHLSGGLLLLFGILLHYTVSGSLELAPPIAGQWLFLLGIGMKVGFVPLHFWIPATYANIHPASTVALSIFTTKAGIVALLKLFLGFEPLVYIGLMMIFTGIYYSLKHHRLREILSYQHITQLGFMVVAIGAGGSLGVNGGFLHMANHMVYKSLLFMITAIILIYSGSEHLKLQKPKPLWLLGFALIGSLAIMGIPPLNGFVSKSVIKYASPGLISQLLNLGAVGTAICFTRFLYYGFWHSPTKPRLSQHFVAVSLEAKLAMGMLSGLVITLGLSTQLISMLLPYGYESTYSFTGALTSVLAVTSGSVLFLLFRGKLQPLLIPSTTLKPVPFLSTINSYLAKVERLEGNMTKLSNAQYLIPAFTLFILLLIIVTVLQQ